MFLSIATTHRPATDLGFVLMKHPDRLHEVELSFGRAHVFFPEASAERCEAVLVLDVDPVGLVRGRGQGDGLLDAYVNDRPYAASSFLSVAIVRAFRSAMAGVSRERQALADAAIPLALTVTPLPGAEALIRKLFEPLGWAVALDRLDGGPSRYGTLRLEGTMRVAEALAHLYVLIPVLDDDKHYWVGDEEVEKLLAKGGDWLKAHPERELIAGRYLKSRRALVREALARLAPEEAQAEAREDVREEASDGVSAPAAAVAAEAPAGSPGRDARERALEAPLRLHDLRLDAVAAALAEAGVATVADLGCGEGKLIARLLRDKRFTTIFGLDASSRSLERASDRLKLDRDGGRLRGRVTLLHGALTYRDGRWASADAAALVEVIEHLEEDRLPELVDAVFGAARPRVVAVTTPNADHNALFPTLRAGAFRHPDHRFEWSRAQFAAWVAAIEAGHGYAATISGIGPDDAERGPVTQMAVFTR